MIEIMHFFKGHDKTKKSPGTFKEKELMLQQELIAMAERLENEAIKSQEQLDRILNKTNDASDVESTIERVEKEIEGGIRYLLDHEEEFAVIDPKYHQLLQQYKVAEKQKELNKKNLKVTPDEMSRAQELKELIEQLKAQADDYRLLQRSSILVPDQEVLPN